MQPVCHFCWQHFDTPSKHSYFAQKMQKILSGLDAANALKNQLNETIAKCKEPPALCVVQVGADPASDSYIRQKHKTALDWGFRFEHKKLPREIPVNEIETQLGIVQKNFDGVILQLPLDRSETTTNREVAQLLSCIKPDSDADGLHPLNLGRISSAESTSDNWTSPIPATAMGVIRMLDHYEVNLRGENITIVGKSRLVGMPLAILLMHRGATVTVCHSQTKDLSEYTLRSSVVIAAAGFPGLLTQKHFNGKQVVIDVGTTVVDKKLRGDLSPEAYGSVAGYSPVPGGVGPMTVAALMENTLRLHLKKRNS
jgi:methylenetetrahydrofolate dehydrogenase (NADP+) / methenyltetrahydrofolate cyclohydrolase